MSCRRAGSAMWTGRVQRRSRDSAVRSGLVPRTAGLAFRSRRFPPDASLARLAAMHRSRYLILILRSSFGAACGANQHVPHAESTVIIIPISHDETTVQRLPWVTFAIMALCLVAFLGTSRGEVEDPDQYLMEPVQYYLGHHYLEVSPELKKRMEETGGSFIKEYNELFGSEQTPEDKPTDPEVLAREQDKLDRLTDRWVEAREKAEHSSMFRGGLIPAKFSFVSLITYMFLHSGWLH